MRTRKLARRRGWVSLDVIPEIDFSAPRRICFEDFEASHNEMDQWCRERIGSENFQAFQILGSRDNWRSRFLFKGGKYLIFFELAWLSK